jgi:hypothetical protein
MTYDELKRRYPTDAPEMPWFELTDDQLGADLGAAARLRAGAADPRQIAGARVIERWIEAELRARSEHACVLTRSSG